MKIPEITGATLLSIEEAREVDKEVLKKVSEDWWLRSPGRYDHRAATVYGEDADIYSNGTPVYRYSCGVRPALKLSNLESSDLKIGDAITFGDHNFTIVSDQYALCDDIIEDCYAFRGRKWDAKDSNNYETSEVKEYIEEWYENTLEQMKNEEKDEYEEEKEM